MLRATASSRLLAPHAESPGPAAAGAGLAAAGAAGVVAAPAAERSAPQSTGAFSSVGDYGADSPLARENRLLEHIASGAALDIVAPELCRAIEDLAPGALCVIRLAPGDAREASSGGPAAATAPVAGVNVFCSPAAAGIHPPLVTERQVVAGLGRDRESRALRRRGIASYWVEPITDGKGGALGVLAAYRRTDGPPAPRDLECAIAVARLAGIAIERARSEERARQQLAQLAHVARLATMGEMASGLAHELNQPLCAIVNYAEACVELVAARGNGNDDLRTALSEVAKQAERAGAVIRRLREFVRWRDLQREPIDLNRMVREVVGLTSAELRHREVRIRLLLTRDSPRVPADAVQVQQVLVNLIRNACDAMGQTPVARRTLTIRTSRAAGALQVAVSDAGPGIPEGGHERIFSAFFSTKRDGMGMGLSISRSIIEAHGGRIWVTANRHGGATFRFTLPSSARRNRGRTSNGVRR